MLGFFHITKGLGIADLTLLSKLQPVFVALIAPLVLGSRERAGWQIWLVLGLCMGGVALIVGPQMSIGDTAGLWALGAAPSSAIAHVCVRGLSRDEPA